MTAASNGDAGATSQEEPKKKRGADRQITKDDRDDDDDDGDGHGTEGGGPPTGTFQKADAATLAKRKIIKVKRPSTTIPTATTVPTAASTTEGNGQKQDDTDTKKSNPFATALSGFSGGATMTSTTIGFSGFGAANATTGFGFANSSNSTTTGAMSLGGFASLGGASKLGDTPFGFASATGSTTVGSAFGSGKSSIFGAADAPKFGFASTGLASSTSGSAGGDVDSSVLLPVDVEVTNGEEGEELLFEMRSKSFQLVTTHDDDNEEETPSAQKETLQPASMSVPPSSSTAPTTAAAASSSSSSSSVGDGQQQQPPSLSGEHGKENVVEQPNDTNNNNNSQQQQNHHRWSELGKGPLRVLRNKETRKARIVQRRENAAGGQGTKLLLNTVLNKDSKLTRPSDKHVQLVTVGTSNGAAVSYLFKVRNPGDAKQLERVLQQVIQSDNSNS